MSKPKRKQSEPRPEQLEPHMMEIAKADWNKLMEDQAIASEQIARIESENVNLKAELEKAKKTKVKTVEKIVEKPVEKIVEKIVEKVVEKPIDRVVEKVVEKPIDRVVEKAVEKKFKLTVITTDASVYTFDSIDAIANWLRGYIPEPGNPRMLQVKTIQLA